MNRSSMSRRLLIASSVLLTIIAWHADAFAAQLTLTWADNSSDEQGFSIERSVGTTGPFSQISTVGPGVTSYTDSSLADVTTYCYRVQAFNGTGSSEYSNTACATTAQTFGLTVLKIGAGSGTVTSAPAGITCGASCSGTYASGTVVTLSASAASGSTFVGWNGGGCSGTGTCTVTVTATSTVTATFAMPSSALTISKAGNGGGTVVSAPAGINCGATCSSSYAGGTNVTLTASPAIGSTFTGWSGGGCSGTGSCAVTVTAATTVTATFTSQLVPLSINITGAGSGTVVSAPAGINCGATCSGSYLIGVGVVLTASPAGGSIFVGWNGGGCSGTGTCTVTMTSAMSVTATFSLQQVTLTTSKAGTGGGTVISVPGGISCGASCSSSYAGGTAVTLTASPAAGSSFTGWSGAACSGTGTCALTLTAPTTVTATFTLQTVGDTTPPTAPAGLGAAAVSSGQINLTWGPSTDNVGVTGYRVERCAGAGCSGFALVVTSSGTSFSDTGLSASTSYSYRVRATDATGNLSGYSSVASVTTSPLASGLVAAYGFSEGTGSTVGDASGNGNTGVITGAAWTAAGRYGGALVFNGTSAQVTVPNAGSLQLTTRMTLEAWVYPTGGLTGWRSVIDKNVDGYYLMASSDPANSPAVGGTWTGGNQNTRAPAGLAVNTWTHLAATFDGATVRLYVNGGLVASQAQTTPLAPTTGTLQLGANAYGEYFQGRIDEVRVYNRDLSQAEIQTDMNTPLTAPASDTAAPSIPEGLTATAMSSGQIDLTWAASTDDVGVTEYRLERCQGAGCANFAQIAASTGTNVSDTGLTGAASYSYRVRAADAAGNVSGYSSPATVVSPSVTLTISRTGTGTGTVTSSPTGIACGSTCSGSYPSGTPVTLTASADAGSSLTGWSGGGCSGTGTCAVTLSAAATVTATFALQPVTLTLSTNGAGSGTVTSSPAGIICGATCSSGFPSGSSVTLSATPAAGSTFTAWSGGGCSGTGTCVLTVTAATTVTATFALQPVTLTLTKAGPGTGTVTSSPAGITCGAACSSGFPNGSSVTLSATAATGSTFAGWTGGGCSGTGTCAVTMAAAVTVTATFALQPATLTVSTSGAGSGTVTSAPAGITCGATCSSSFPNGSSVMLTATPAAGSTFTGWSGGGCSGTGTCAVIMASATTVTATFALQPVTLTLTKAGTGGGAVTSVPAGISCGASCSSSYASGIAVTLTASPAAGSSFTGWSGGACSGTGTCALTLTAPTTVTATFTLQTVGDTTPPTAPVSLAATAVSSGQINLTWGPSTDNVGVTGYRVERCGGAACSGFALAGAPSGTSFSDTGLSASTSYSYRVRATDATGNLSGYSSVASATTSTPATGLVAAYGFSEGTGTTLGDASGNGNTGVIAGATWTAAGRYGGALVFNGTSARVTVPNAASLQLTTRMTLEAWVYPTGGLTGWRSVIDKNVDRYYLMASSDPANRPAVGGTWTGGNQNTRAPAGLAVNTWTHLAATFDGATVRLYVNGGLVASQAQTTPLAPTTGTLQLGANAYGEYFQGRIDEVRIYNRALSQAEIQTDMNTPVAALVP